MATVVPLTVVLNWRPANAHALNVLAGALDSLADQPELEIRFADRADELEVVVQEARQRRRRVVVAWSFYSTNFAAQAAELRAFRQRYPDPQVLHIAGGVHATAEPRQTLAAGFDYVCIGEGEQAFLKAVEAWLAGEAPDRVQGFVYLKGDRFHSNGPAQRIDLDAWPPFAERHQRFNAIEITRGCIYSCKFCQTPFMFKARFRHRSVPVVCAAVEVLKRHGLTDIRFVTPTSLSYGSEDAAPNLEAVAALLEGVRRTLGNRGRIFFGTFPSEVRPEHVTREALRLLKRFVANDNLVIGGQSGSERLLRETRRGHNVEVIEHAVRLCLEEGFLPNVDFIFGLPGETPDDAEASVRFAERLAALGARIHNHTFMPLPGTPYRSAPPGRIAPEVQKRLDKLAAQGRLYGQWRRQEQLAVELAARRRVDGQHVSS